MGSALRLKRRPTNQNQIKDTHIRPYIRRNNMKRTEQEEDKRKEDEEVEGVVMQTKRRMTCTTQKELQCLLINALGV